MPGGQEYVEPSAADVIECPGGEVHGMAILLDKEAEERMDQLEVVGFGYRKKYVEFQAYDGRKLQGGGNRVFLDLPPIANVLGSKMLKNLPYTQPISLF